MSQNEGERVTESQLNDDLIGIREFAKLVGVSAPSIVNAIDAGRLTAATGAKGSRKLRRAESIAQWQQIHAPKPQTESTKDNIETGGLHGPQWGLVKTQQEALLARERRLKLELERGELEGSLHRSEDVESVWSETLMRFRAKMLGLPTTAAPIIAAIPKRDPARIQAELERLIHEALTELSGYDADKIKTARRRREAKAK